MWIEVPGAGLEHSALFIKRDDNGRIITPAPDSPDWKDVVEREILRNCVVLTIGQRCADWFVLRQFRVTGTNAGRFLMEDENVRTELGSFPRHIATVGEGMKSLTRSTTEKIQALVSSCSSTARSTEAMMRVLVLHVSHVVYVAASETGVMFIIIAYCDLSTLSLCELALEQAAGECVDWAYEVFLDMPLANDSDFNKLLKAVCRFGNSQFLCFGKGPFYPPLKLFRHGVQTLY
jgi:hypothetical protein